MGFTLIPLQDHVFPIHRYVGAPLRRLLGNETIMATSVVVLPMHTRHLPLLAGLNLAACLGVHNAAISQTILMPVRRSEALLLPALIAPVVVCWRTAVMAFTGEDFLTFLDEAPRCGAPLPWIVVFCHDAYACGIAFSLASVKTQESLVT